MLTVLIHHPHIRREKEAKSDYQWRGQYKNVAFLSYKNVEKPTFLYDIFI